MPIRSQSGLEYLSIVVAALVAMGMMYGYVESYKYWQEIDYRFSSILSQIEDSAEAVFLMGPPSRQTLNLYIPGYVDESRTFISNNTINYGVYTPAGTQDMFKVFDFCVKGELPTREGYYKINIVSVGKCVVIDYENIFVEPNSLNLSILLDTNVSKRFDIISLFPDEQNISIVVEGDISSYVDIDSDSVGRQSSIVHNFSPGEVFQLPITFFGDSVGEYGGELKVGNITVPLWLFVVTNQYIPPSIYNTTSNSTVVRLGTPICINATVEKGSEPIDSVWTTLLEPRGCWTLNGSCSDLCTSSSIVSVPTYNFSGCNETCNPSSELYQGQGVCSDDGSGSCYHLFNQISGYSKCIAQSHCSQCEGTPLPCSSIQNCSSCGCDGGSVPTVVWSDTLATDDGWQPWGLFGGIIYSGSRNCALDGNSYCMEATWWPTQYTIDKSKPLDLSSCSPGSATFTIGHVWEEGSLERNDCMRVYFSNDGGRRWSFAGTIFCDDLPRPIRYSIPIDDSFLTTKFLVRIEKSGFTWREHAYLDDFSITCSLSHCTGTPSPCSSHSDEESCSYCGCNWMEGYNWTSTELVQGYSSYEECVWDPNGVVPTNITLYDYGPWCSGNVGDKAYGAEYIMNYAGNNTLKAGYVNDTTGYTDEDLVNINIEVVPHTNTTVFFEDFVPTPYYNYNWTREGTDWDSRDNSNCHSIGGCAHSDWFCDEQHDWIETRDNLINLSTANNAYVSLYIREDVSFDIGEYFRVWCHDGSSWVKIYEEDMGEWTNNGQYHKREFVVASSCLISNAKFRITSQSNSKNEDLYIDDFKVVMES